MYPYCIFIALRARHLAESWDAWACRLAKESWKTHRRRGLLDLDDMFQAARLGLWEAAVRFDSRRGVPFPGYARSWVRVELRDYMSGEVARGLHMTARERKQFQLQPVARFSEAEPAAGDLIPDREHQEFPGEEVWERVRPLLNERDYGFLVARFRDGEEYPAIAARAGHSKQWVCQVVHRSVAILRDGLMT